jgi:hypothetical protein
MAQIFGNYIEEKVDSCEYLKIGFSPTSIPIQQRWRNNGLSADFLADYLSTFFPGEEGDSTERQAEVKDAVAYIANELLENAMKFSYTPAKHAVSIDLYLEVDAINFYVTNSIDPQALGAFQHFIQRLLSEDIDDLYMEQLTRNAEDTQGESGLGCLTMLQDYGTLLAWKFERHDQDDDVVTVTTMARLSV